MKEVIRINTIYGKTFEGKTFTVRIENKGSREVAVPFDNEYLLPVN